MIILDFGQVQKHCIIFQKMLGVCVYMHFGNNCWLSPFTYK